MCLKMLQRFLMRSGRFTVTTALDGTEAVELVTKKQQRFDAILIDQNMTLMNGTEGALPLTAALPRVPSHSSCCRVLMDSGRFCWLSHGLMVRCLLLATLTNPHGPPTTTATAAIRAWEAEHSAHPPAPVLAVTANASDADQILYAKHGADGLVRFPLRCCCVCVVFFCSVGVYMADFGPALLGIGRH